MTPGVTGFYLQPLMIHRVARQRVQAGIQTVTPLQMAEVICLYAGMSLCEECHAICLSLGRMWGQRSVSMGWAGDGLQSAECRVQSLPPSLRLAGLACRPALCCVPRETDRCISENSTIYTEGSSPTYIQRTYRQTNRKVQVELLGW